MVKNVPKLIKSLKTAQLGVHILKGGAAILASPFDILDLLESAIDLHHREQGPNACKDAIAGLTFASISFVSSVGLTTMGVPGVGTAVGLAIMVAQGAYSGLRMIEEFEPYRLTWDENFRLFWHMFALQSVPSDMEYLKARKDILDQLVKQIEKQLQTSDPLVVAYATGLGQVRFKEEQDCIDVGQGTADYHRRCTHRKIKVPQLLPS